VTGIARIVRRSAVLAVALGSVCLVTACGAATHTFSASSGSPLLTVAHGAAPSLQRTRAETFARRLLNDLRLPGATSPERFDSLATIRPMLPSAVRDFVDLRAFYRSDHPALAVRSFLAAHVSSRLAAGASAIMTSHGRESVIYSADYTPKALPRYFYEATVATAIAPSGSGAALLRVDVQVSWYPPRPRELRVNSAMYRAVIVTLPLRRGVSSRLVSKTFVQSAIIEKLARVINRLPVLPQAGSSCGALTTDSTYRLIFKPRRSSNPEVVVETLGCTVDTLSVGRARQVPLSDQAMAVVAILKSLVKPSTSGRG
jgi:hypothetical protein